MIDDFVRPPKRPRTQVNTKNKQALSRATPPDTMAEAPFVPPEKVAEHEVDAPEHIDDEIDMSVPPTDHSEKIRWWTRASKWFKALSRKQKAALIVAAVVALSAIGGGLYALLKDNGPKVKVVPAANVKPVPKSDKVPSTLTGLLVAPDVNKVPVTAVMIENSRDARPQSGLSDAGVVFEAIAEGGITRFMALYQDTSPESVGPVRSVRPYYLDWAHGFDASIAHVGGSPEALQQIKNEGLKDLDQFYNSKYYNRVNSRYAPHNVYTSIPKLNELEASKGIGGSNFTGFARKKDAPAKQPTASAIQVNISSKLYNSSYTYDTATNSYLRTMANQPHVDEKSGKQIAPKVVIALVTRYGIQNDGKHSEYDVVGSGQAIVFQDGTATTVNWQKPAKDKQITFTDNAGKTFALNAGQTWIVAVDNAQKIAWQP